jgi:lactose/L-arabinose transport system ATP-binding protein
MSGLKLRRVSKSFGAVEVIKNVDLDINSKEFVVFVGPSGCGKSTLLRMIAGLEEVSSGDIEIGGQRVNDVDPSKRGIAMVFQTYALYPHMTVRENMGFALRFAGVPKPEIAKQVDEAARMLELGPLMDRRPKELSGGQRQRVAIGRAIVRHPQVFLFDEPLSNLDAELRVHMRVEISRLHKELGVTMIYVTHDQTEAMTLADRIVVLRAGNIEQVGEPLDVYDDPANQFVAGFVGSPKMNFLKGRITESSGGAVTIELTGLEGARIRKTLGGNLPAAGSAVIVGIRPEHFDDPGKGNSEITLRIDITEHLGSTSYLYARTAEGEELIVERSTSREEADRERVTVSIPASKVYLFDGSGQRLR